MPAASKSLGLIDYADAFAILADAAQSVVLVRIATTHWTGDPLPFRVRFREVFHAPVANDA